VPHSLLSSHEFPTTTTTTTLLPPAGSVGEVARLVAPVQHVVHGVERAEAHAHGDGALDPVHAQALVEATHDALRGHDVPHGAQDRAPAATGGAEDTGRLHAPAHHVQRVGGRLPHHARARPERQPLVGVRLGPLGLFWRAVRDELMN